MHPNKLSNRSKQLLTRSALAALALLAGASAPTANAEPAATTGAPGVPFRHQGFALSVGGGVSGYVDQAARDHLETGGYWEVRALLGSRSYLASEIAYVGSARGLAAPDASELAAMVGTGIESALRLNLPLSEGPFRFTPFVFIGPGFTHMAVAGYRGAQPGMKSSDTALVFTSGAGLGVSYRQVAVTGRFTYRQLRGADLIRTGSGNASLNSWAAGLSLGHEL
jgi:hypothetical protein